MFWAGFGTPRWRRLQPGPELLQEDDSTQMVPIRQNLVSAWVRSGTLEPIACLAEMIADDCEIGWRTQVVTTPGGISALYQVGCSRPWGSPWTAPSGWLAANEDCHEGMWRCSEIWRSATGHVLMHWGRFEACSIPEL